LKKIYFCGSIRGGRQLAATYEKLISLLQNYCEVLTEHIGEKSVIMSESRSYTDEYIYERDMSWLKESDLVIAEVTTPSLGVGYEIGRAIENNIPVFCFYKNDPDFKLSAMIAGSDNINCISYSNAELLFQSIDTIFQNI